MTFTGFPASFTSRDPAVQALARFGFDDQTGVVGTTLTLANAPVDGTLQLFKNGALLHNPTNYTISGATVTLGVASIAPDLWQAYFHFRQAT